MTEAEKARFKKLDQYMQVVVDNFLWAYPQVIETLGKIKDIDRRLLALHRYIRFIQDRDLNERWAWTHEEIETWKKSAEAAISKSEIARVVKKFNSLPDSLSNNYKLSGGSHPRDLEQQIALWNKNGSVNTIGTCLRKKAFKELEKEQYPDPPDYNGMYSFFHVLAAEWPTAICGEPTNATPGLSAHGQMRAVDFHVRQNGTKIAQSGGKAFWKSSGLADLLKKAIDQANAELGRKAFDGPLKSPDEPWHYKYDAAG